MRKLLLLLIFFPLALMSQSKFGYFSYKAVLDSLPQYKVAMDCYDKLKQRCLKEVDHNEQELTRFYVAFLDGQRDFPEPILRKRQKELQQMIDNSIVFRDQLKKWLHHAKDSLARSSYQAVDSALPRVCTELSLSYAIDIDNGAYKFINPMFGRDITQDVISVILYPERPLIEIVEVEEVAPDSVMHDGVPATEVEIPATEIDIPATEIPVEDAQENRTHETEQVEMTVLEIKNEETVDSINNKQ